MRNNIVDLVKYRNEKELSELENTMIIHAMIYALIDATQEINRILYCLGAADLKLGDIAAEIEKQMDRKNLLEFTYLLDRQGRNLLAIHKAIDVNAANDKSTLFLNESVHEIAMNYVNSGHTRTDVYLNLLDEIMKRALQGEREPDGSDLSSPCQIGDGIDTGTGAGR